MRIKQDHSRFRQIVRGKVRQNLKQYISTGTLIGKQGRTKCLSLCLKSNCLDFDSNQKDGGGTGQGEGQPE